MTERPDRIIILTPYPLGLPFSQAMAEAAVDLARQRLPKITGRLAGSLVPVFGENYFGIHFPDKVSWFLEKGTNPFTMNSLQGKTIPMWIDDPNGELSKENPKAKTRITVDGRKQTLIFRHASYKGQRKMVFRNGQWTSVPRSYPGAPGRISVRSANGQIGKGNVGVRWRHPGIDPRYYLNSALSDVQNAFGINAMNVILIDSATFPTATKA